MANVLVDTSAWIEFFRKDGEAAYRNAISTLLDDNEAALCGIVLTELLKGARSDKEYRELEDRLATLVYLETPEVIWKQAGRLASQLLRRGVQVPTTDLVIATIAIENRLPLLQKDRHFPILQRQTDLQLISH